MRRIIFLSVFFFILGYNYCKGGGNIKITVVGIDWSSSMYILNEREAREKIFTLFRNIIKTKNLPKWENFLIKFFKGETRGLPLETIIFVPIASDELSFREKIYCGTPEEILNLIGYDEEKIFPPLKNYTTKTDFIDFFKIAKNKVEKQIEIMNDHVSVKKGYVKIIVDYILITDGIHDPKGIINLPKDIENVKMDIIYRFYPNFSVEEFANSLETPENLRNVFFIGVPVRIQFDLWEKVGNIKKFRCFFFQYNELKNERDIQMKINRYR
jgi:hypothetical protein